MRKDIFTKTRRNIMVMSVGIVMGTLIIFSIITEYVYRETLFEAVDQKLLTHKNMILTDAHINYDGDTVKEVVLPSPLIKELISYVWQKDTLVKGSPHTYKGSHTYPQFPDKISDEIYSIVDGTYHYRGVQFMYEGCRVQLLLSIDDEMNSLDNLRRALLTAFFVLLIVALLLAFYLAKLALKPLHKTYNKQVSFIQDASHEMRTPLAVIRGKMELMAKNSGDPIYKHFDELSHIMSEISGLEKMNKDLLLMSKEDMKGILEIKTVQITPFFEEVVEIYKELANLHDIYFDYHPLVEDYTVEWDETKVKRCINILLENAIKYSSREDRITLDVEKQDKFIRVKVSDTGQGIKKEELTHIFDRFYRSSEVRASGIEGSGIGLSLLQSLAYTMGIKIKVHSIYNEGSTFILEIPIKMVK